MSPPSRLTAPLALAAALVALVVLPGSAAAAGPQVALGVNTAGAPGKDGSALDAFASRAGRRPATVMWYQTWAEPLFYSSQMQAVQNRGAVPLVTWEPTGRVGLSLRSIAAGRHDSYLRAAARSARGWGRTFFVRFAHEMNGGWYSWGRRAGNSSRDYVRAWRHVVTVFRRAGARNVRWVWSPNAIWPGVAAFRSFYPGDRWVDWVGLDGYNWGAHRRSGWRSFTSVFAASYRSLAALTGRPMMIAEVAAPERGGDKAAWILSGLTRELPRRFPRVRALVWFDRNKDADWRVDSSLASLLAFRLAMKAGPFGLSASQLLAIRGASPPALRVSARRSGRRIRLRGRVGTRAWGRARVLVSVRQGRRVRRVRMRLRGNFFGARVRGLRRGRARLRVVIRGAGGETLLRRSLRLRIR